MSSSDPDGFTPRLIEYFYSGPVTRLGVRLPGFRAEGSLTDMTDAECCDDAHDLGGIAVLIDGYDREIRE